MQKGFSTILALIIGLLVVGGGVYFYLNRTDISEDTKETDISFQENDSGISLVIDGAHVQTIDFDRDTMEGFEIAKANPSVKKFITDLDVNFDGQNDVGVFTSTGYAGVNNFYDFYVYNPKTQRLEKQADLKEISNPGTDVDGRKVISAYRSGPFWYEDSYVYENGTYRHAQDPDFSSREEDIEEYAAKQDRVDADMEFGFLIKYPSNYTLTKESDGQMSFSFDSSRGPVRIRKSLDKADDSTGKWGTYVLSYSSSGWVVERANERDGGTYVQSVSPAMYTDSGLPIFNGGVNGHGWGGYNYIVSLSDKKFLIISGPDRLNEDVSEYDENSDPTLLIAKRIQVIK